MAARAVRRLGELSELSGLPELRRTASRNDPDAPNDLGVEADFEKVPSSMIAQIIEGVLYTMPRPGQRHTKATSRLMATLGSTYWRDAREPGEPGGWVIVHEPELHLGPKPDKLVPDLAGWRSGRVNEDIGDADPAFYEIVPDWVCEVLSPRTENIDRIKKMHIYLREKVEYVWLIHPLLRTLEVYRLEGERYSRWGAFEGEEAVRAEPFEGIEVPLSQLWMGTAPS